MKSIPDKIQFNEKGYFKFNVSSVFCLNSAHNCHDLFTIIWKEGKLNKNWVTLQINITLQIQNKHDPKTYITHWWNK